MKVLVPLMTHSSPWRTAVVSSEVMSEPCPGSVNAPPDSMRPSATGGQESALELLAAEAQDALGGEARQDDGAADAGVACAELLGDQDVLEHPQPLARVGLGVVHPYEAQLRRLLPDRPGELVFAVELERQLPVELPFGELPRRLLDLLLCLAEFKIHGPPLRFVQWLRTLPPAGA